MFFASGFIFATWGVHVPTVKLHYAMDEAQLGLALFAAGIGALLGLTRASHWIGRYGARHAACASGAVYALLLLGLLTMPGYPWLLALLLMFGVVTSVFDVAINTEAAQIELRSRRPLMSGMHGMFSLGGMAGALVGSTAIALGVAARVHLSWVAIAMTLTVVLSARWMLPASETRFAASSEGFMLPRGVLAMLGLLAALGLIAEGAIYDWSVLYLKQELGSPQEQAALAYGFFSAAMAATRFVGDRLRARFEPTHLLRASALVAAASMSLALLTDRPLVALACFAGVGVGFANVVPLLFAASSRLPGVEPARGIAGVAALGYTGFMVGPPFIGFIAQGTNLTTALFVVVAFALVLAALARQVAAR
ncbi:MFS transporter [Burkholderiales bacterium 8X]|nr:MFS transporter [Burkholderiales bacterium 8X]